MAGPFRIEFPGRRVGKTKRTAITKATVKKSYFKTLLSKLDFNLLILHKFKIEIAASLLLLAMTLRSGFY